MDTQARNGSGTPLDPQRLRYLTASVQALQQPMTGLAFAVFGAIWLLMPLDNDYRLIPGRWLPALIMVVGLIAVFRLVPRYYRWRFGRVEPKLSNLSNKQFSIFLLVMIVLFLISLGFGHSLDRYSGDLLHRVHLVLSDPTGRVHLFPLAMWVIWLSVSLLPHSSRMFDPYEIFFVCCGTTMCAFIVLYPHWHPGAMQSTLWRVLNGGSFGISLMTVGSYNHLTLIRMMPKKFAENDDE
jgi:hypothetical protein